MRIHIGDSCGDGMFHEGLGESSFIFGNVREMFENARVTFGQCFKHLRKSTESGVESVGILQKRRYHYKFL